MKRPFLVLVNGVLWDRTISREGALKVIKRLKANGLNAVLGYDMTMTIGGNGNENLNR